MKTCSRCHQSKLPLEFSKDKHAPDGLRYSCKACSKEASLKWKREHLDRHRSYARRRRIEKPHLVKANLLRWRTANPDRCKHLGRKSRLKKYGLSVGGYDDLLTTQGGKCAVCRVPASLCKRRLAVDHCHATGRVRGLLCPNCNNGLGRFKDSAERLRAAAAYLEACEPSEVVAVCSTG